MNGAFKDNIRDILRNIPKPPQALNPKPSNNNPGADVDMEDPKTRECGMMLPRQSQNSVSLTGYTVNAPLFLQVLGVFSLWWHGIPGSLGFRA